MIKNETSILRKMAQTQELVYKIVNVPDAKLNYLLINFNHEYYKNLLKIMIMAIVQVTFFLTIYLP